MVLDIFTIIGALGITLISIGIIRRKRKNQDIFYVLGGLFLLSYSIYIKEIIFIILQTIFIITAIYDLIKKIKCNI